MTERLNVDADETAPIERPNEVPNRFRVARVNLLPPEFARERRHRRVAAAGFGLLALYVLALGVVYVLKLDAVSEARAERDATQREVTTLRAEAESLREFQLLATQLETRESLLTAAMTDEISWARVLGDLALTFSRQSSLIQVAAVTVGSDAAVAGGAATTPVAASTEDGEPAPGTPVAQVSFGGYSIERFAPGVEDVLANFRGEELFVKPFLASAVEEERGDEEVTAFEGRVDLSDEVYTHRYDEGLPEESVQ